MSIPSKRALKRNRLIDFIKKSFTEDEATELERQFDDVLAASDEEEATDDIMAENESLRSANAELEAKVADLTAQIAELNEKLKAEEDDAAAKAAEDDAKEEEQAIDQAIDDAITESCGADEVIKKHFVGMVDRSKLGYNKETKEVTGLAEQIDVISKSFTDLSAALTAQKNTTVGLPKTSGAKATSTTSKVVKFNSDPWN